MSARNGASEQVQPLYISAACSRSNSSAARPQDGLVAFASGHLIALWKSAVRARDYSPQQTRDGLKELTGCYDYQNELSAGVHRTLPGHKGDVTALEFVQGSAKSRYLVSGDATGEVKVWKEHEEHVSDLYCGQSDQPHADTVRDHRQWTLLATLTGHQGSVSAVIGLQLSGDDDAISDDLLILSGGSDSTIRVSRVSDSSQGV